MDKAIELGRQNVKIALEECAFEGVKRIATKLAQDICLVTDVQPEIVTVSENSEARYEQQSLIFCATLGNSPVLDRLEAEGKLDLSGLKGKREVYKIAFAENAFPGAEQTLIICGSDKRGTIYGMFGLSEYLGVTPVCFWGDAAPAKKKDFTVGADVEILSKEPSVKYRGFFINDEWPCFGNWVGIHYGGFNAKAYEHVFEFLLRMKGNYLWPAMWSASFPLDGPGSANEELADIYGVVMGYSHHEPCLRASEEWDKVRGPETKYGNEWNFYTNEQGLLNYWEDALIRSGKYDNMITIGMRGERDTSMLGENSTVAENIELLKRIITKQRGLIAKHVNADLSQVPQLLALYKEVEEYYYGDENTPGLKDWDGLDGVTCMLCEDNFGHMRTLPTEEVRGRKGGFGMYYHYDYHGGPVSYEWVDSTPFSKMWEQMSMAYEYGVRDVWIVNVGDVKFHEVPLTYFMALAYDYDKWGYGNLDSYNEYAKMWSEKTFPEAGENREKIAKVLLDYININHMRRPEALHEGIYHPCHYGETDRMLAKAEEIQKRSAEIYESLNEREKKAYYSMIHFSATASMNLLKMHLYAGKNKHYALQGRPVANTYGDLVAQCIEQDRVYAAEFAEFEDGKWKGMQMAQHIGFVTWNEDGYRYPIIMRVEPAHKPRMTVSAKTDERIAVKNYGAPQNIEIKDFTNPDCTVAVFEIANGGVGSFTYEITPEGGEMPAWLTAEPMSGEVSSLQEVVLTCDKEKLNDAGIAEKVRLLVRGEETCVAVDVTAAKMAVREISAGTFLARDGVIVMNANHFSEKKDTEKGAWTVLEGYGSYGVGVKVMPTTASFAGGEEKPTLTYNFFLEEAGEYQVEVLTAPTNPTTMGSSLNVMLRVGNGVPVKVQLVPADFKAGNTGDWRWCNGVLDQVRKVTVPMTFGAGTQQLTIGALDAGVVLERIRIYKSGVSLKNSYLGPEETYRV